MKLKSSKEPLYFKEINTNVGKIILCADNYGLTDIKWGTDNKYLDCRENDIIVKTEEQLNEYFAGLRKVFDIPLNPKGTPFQLKAWGILKTIPYGEIISYQEQARRMGDVKKARAVGQANARNPIPIIIPCHRVIGKNGNLKGYARGQEIKKFLIDLEQGSLLV